MFAVPLGFQKLGASFDEGGCRVFAAIQRRKVDQLLYLHLSSDFGDVPARFHVTPVEGVIPSFVIPTDEVDDDVGITHGFSQRVEVIGLVIVEQGLAQVATQSETQRFIIVSSVRDDQLAADLAETVAEVAADEAGSAENSDDETVET